MKTTTFILGLFALVAMPTRAGEVTDPNQAKIIAMCQCLEKSVDANCLPIRDGNQPNGPQSPGSQH